MVKGEGTRGVVGEQQSEACERKVWMIVKGVRASDRCGCKQKVWMRA